MTFEPTGDGGGVSHNMVLYRSLSLGAKLYEALSRREGRGVPFRKNTHTRTRLNPEQNSWVSDKGVHLLVSKLSEPQLPPPLCRIP